MALLGRRLGAASSARDGMGRLRALVARLSDRFRRGYYRVLDGVVALARRVERVPARVREWLRERPSPVGIALGFGDRIRRAVLGALRSLMATIRSLRRGDDETAADDAAPRDPVESTADLDSAELTLNRLWTRFLAALSLSQTGVRTWTPGDVARHAVERGFPEGPVYEVTDAYREALYGDRWPSTDALDRLRTVVGSLDGEAGQNSDESEGERP
ncbi:DUF4129 domain-containing protein [Haloarculaceae archaeon H-GB2-1]|nr:DUF4129 domain-containing protein [Haloarculaceae archaeon H-GB2-1]